MYIADGNVEKYKIALNLVLFTRGIPVIFYGTEIGIKGTPLHGELRKTFPGGFEDDVRNAFLPNGRSELENEIFDYLNELLKLRKNYPVLASGKLTQIYIDDDIYFLIKTLGPEQIIIMINSGELDFPLSEEQIYQFLPDVKSLKNLKTKEIVEINSGVMLQLQPFSSEIYKIK
jgi:glycosidase